MSKKSVLRKQRKNTVINATSKQQEEALIRAITYVEKRISEKFPTLTLSHKSRIYLSTIVSSLKTDYPTVEFECNSQRTFMVPDGGILSIVDHHNNEYPILIAEKKNQGTNDLRTTEGKKKQAKGNAIERLGKNVIGFRTALKSKSIFPFVCFGDGCDFAEGSTILDRVITIAQFGKLNQVHLNNEGPNGEFDRGSFYFRVKEWSADEMAEISYTIAERSIYHYFSVYGESSFI